MRNRASANLEAVEVVLMASFDDEYDAYIDEVHVMRKTVIDGQ